MPRGKIDYRRGLLYGCFGEDATGGVRVKATNDYLVRAVGGPADGCGLALKQIETRPIAISRLG
jgi:hypothetical protein